MYFTITSQTHTESSTNPISAAAVLTNLPLNICNNINVQIHLYCKGLQTDKHRMALFRLIMYVLCENTTAEKSEQSTLTKFQRTQPL
jgi:Ni,Fe-hydrogenase I cytochrome b subunit